MNYWKKTFCLALIAAVVAVLTVPTPTYAAATLKINSKGKDVIALQQKLQELNYKITNIDGIFGNETKRAVLEFQRDKRIKITGTVDSRTWRELKRAKPPLPVIKPKPNRPGNPGNSEPNRPNLPQIVPETPPFVPKQAIPRVIKTAKSYIGTPYKFGGTTPKGFDCSGYLQYVFAKQKITLPRSADQQYTLGKKVRPSLLQTGDLVFFSTYEQGASHCGIYLGDGKFIHVSSSKGVRIDKLQDPYWQPKYLGAKRITK